MGEVRKLSNNELDTRIKELSKWEVDLHKNPEETAFYKGEGADNFFNIRLHECSSESLCSRMNLGMSWFQF